MQLNRRQFVAGCVSSFAAATLARELHASCTGVRITRIVGFDLRTRRNKVAGKNARLDVHGDSATDPMVRIYTDQDGLEGLGVCRAGNDRLSALLGRSPGEFLSDRDSIRKALGSQTMPLWDLVGRMQNKPVCDLLGAAPGAGRTVPVYDGSIYFADLLPEYVSAWEDRFKREIDMGFEMGHRAFKIKVGRGAKWMPRAEGDARDIAVVTLIRAHAGKDVILGVDANNGYDLDGAKRFVEATAGARLAFTEELFPEVVEQCLALKEHFRSLKLDTLLADGETQDSLDAFKPFVAANAIDVLQADMNRFGVEGMLDEAAMGRAKGIRIAPHNWGSLMGFYQQLQVGPAVENFYRAEHDPLSTDIVVADGVTIKDGRATLPSGPGFGLRIDEARFAAEAKIKFDLKA